MSPPGRRLLLALAVVSAALLGRGEPAQAHADLIESDPAPSSVLEVSPAAITLRFTEAVDTVDDSIRLVAADGSEVGIGPIGQEGGADTITATIDGELSDGSYAVAWRAVSADSHNVRGAFVFSVGEETEVPDIGALLAGSDDSTSSGVWLGLGRWTSFLGIGAAVGAIVAAMWVAPTALGSRRLRVVVAIAGAIGVAGTVLMIAAQASSIGASWFDGGAVVGTRSGWWWMARAVVAGVVSVAAYVGARRLPPSERVTRGPLVLAVAGALVVCAVVAAGGHAVTGERPTIGFAATVAHLAAMSLWLGGLCVVGLVVGRGNVVRTAQRFSPLALGAVVVLALSGTANTVRQVGSWSLFAESTYGRWLIVKLVIVVFVVLVASITRKLLRDTARYTDGDPEETATSVRRTVSVELVGMAFVLAATAGLTNSPPVPDAPPIAAATSVQGDRIALVELDPAVTGGTEMHVTITSPSGGLDAAEEITVTAQLAERGLGPIDIPVVPAGPNHVLSYDADLPVGGLWTMTVRARYGEFEQVVFTVELPVVPAR
jgi:copper transport protein